jgi:DNA-binding NarL/FixJ family response regulator
MQPRQISKTVQQRQLKRMRPRRYEILIRLLNGQSQRKIARELGLGEQRVSVIINSPVFQEELRKRWEVREQAIIQ